MGASCGVPLLLSRLLTQTPPFLQCNQLFIYGEGGHLVAKQEMLPNPLTHIFQVPLDCTSIRFHCILHLSGSTALCIPQIPLLYPSIMFCYIADLGSTALHIHQVPLHCASTRFHYFTRPPCCTALQIQAPLHCVYYFHIKYV